MMTFDKWFAGYAPTAPECLDDCAKAAWEAGELSEREACASLIAGDELWMIASKEERRELAESILERSNAALTRRP